MASAYTLDMSRPFPIQTFDRESEFVIAQRRLPHWSQAGTLTFITWRTNDSIPHAVLMEWRKDRCRWLVSHEIDPDDKEWRQQLAMLSQKQQQDFHRYFSDRWQEELDSGHGECVLRNPELAQIVANSLAHFDDTRYVLTDFVIMPNHVHLLAAFEDEPTMLAQCESWKHFTAREINKLLDRKGRFWEQDGFDHLIRSDESFAYYRSYVGDNPKKANLAVGEFIHFTKATM